MNPSKSVIKTINLDKFKSWLELMGCQILLPTNEYEKIRFKGREVGVIYSTGKVANTYSKEAVRHFVQGKNDWKGRPSKVPRKTSYKKQKEKILVRDGDNCFLCGDPLNADITLEHLVPLATGGPNELWNMVLCHKECNEKLGNKSLPEKVNMSIKTRIDSKIKSQTK